MLKKILQISCLSCLAIVAGANDSNADASASLNVKANIVTGLSITSQADLDFGTLLLSGDVSAAGTGTVTVDHSDISNGTVSAGTSGLSLLGGDSSGKLLVNGQAGATVNVAVTNPNGDVLSEPTGSTAPINLTTPATVLLGADGAGIVYVGGTLTVASNQTEGVYSGTATVLVNY